MSVRTTFTAQGCHSYVGRHSTLPYSAIPFVAGSTKAPAQASRQLQQVLQVSAKGSRQTRLATKITTIPRRVDLYFSDRPLRRAMWAGIAFFSGYYCANTVSLSFGALAINDVVAAALTVAFCEVVSAQYYSAAKVTLKLLFANCFKIGIICALIADAFKLGG